jgi:HEAT repeat protein
MRPRYRDLFDAFLDPDPARADAAYDAVLFDRAEALPDLTELYNQSADEPGLRFYAIQLMGFSEAAEAIPIVERALKDEDPGVRAEACRALEDLRARDSGAALEEASEDADAKVRRAAREAMSALGITRRR